MILRKFDWKKRSDTFLFFFC